jgi:hypothetical protein
MREHDPLHALLEEWKAPEPSPELDRRVAAAYRKARPRPPVWRRFLRARVSIPVPVLAVGVLAAILVLLVFRIASTPKPLTVSPNVVSQLNATGFLPLPNGQARVLSVAELKTEVKK